MKPRRDLPTFKAELAEAIAQRDARRIGCLADAARMSGLNYRELTAIATAVGRIDAGEWETLLEEADRLEGEA